MKNYFHKIARHTALILISLLAFTFPANVLAEAEKERSISHLSIDDKATLATKRKILTEQNQQVVFEILSAISTCF